MDGWRNIVFWVLAFADKVGFHILGLVGVPNLPWCYMFYIQVKKKVTLLLDSFFLANVNMFVEFPSNMDNNMQQTWSVKWSLIKLPKGDAVLNDIRLLLKTPLSVSLQNIWTMRTVVACFPWLCNFNGLLFYFGILCCPNVRQKMSKKCRLLVFI